ncbi:MAG: S8 family peptidase [Cellulosilyticaceae bacterium]
MYNTKLSPQLQLALKYRNILSPNAFLGTIGYPISSPMWELVVTYFGSITGIEAELGVEVTLLSENFAIVVIDSTKIGALSDYPQVVYIEFPEVMDYIIEPELSDICVTQSVLDQGNYALTGKGILVGIIDSGIDYNHMDFMTPEGKTRIVSLWDQTGAGSPPEGFKFGTEYTRDQIDEALSLPLEQRSEVVPERDILGHGTAVAGVAVGNGRGSNGQYKGVATESELVIVKLRNPLKSPERGPRNVEAMLGMNYVIQKARELERPVVMMIGLGVNEGSHRGDNVLELFINQQISKVRGNMVVGTGNQGNKESHTAGKLKQGQIEKVQIYIDRGQPYYFFSLWKNFADTFAITLETPSGEQTEVLNGIINNRAFNFGNTTVLINFSEPTTLGQAQQILVFLESQEEEGIAPGIWTLQIDGEDVVDGMYNIWGSSIDPYERRTRFLKPVVETTLTIPSTAQNLTSVAAYSSSTQQIRAFSGRGYTADNRIKPDIAAPGFNVMAPKAGTVNGYTRVSGTSIAAGFTVGAYAVLMEYGIIRNDDPFLYGGRLEAYVQKNARRNPIHAPYPNEEWGYGSLCVADVLSDLRKRYNA